MDYFVNYRTISFEGQPTEIGVFNFEVILYVEGPVDENGDDTLCNNTTSKIYTLIIEDAETR